MDLYVVFKFAVLGVCLMFAYADDRWFVTFRTKFIPLGIHYQGDQVNISVNGENTLGAARGRIIQIRQNEINSVNVTTGDMGKFRCVFLGGREDWLLEWVHLTRITNESKVERFGWEEQDAMLNWLHGNSSMAFCASYGNCFGHPGIVNSLDSIGYNESYDSFGMLPMSYI